MPEVVADNTTQANKAVDFGSGRYSNIMKECYADCKRELGFTSAQAEKTARALGAELGRLQMNPELKFGQKLAKDGTITLAEAAKIKGVQLTYCLSIAKVLSAIQDLKKFGLVSVIDGVKFSVNIEEWLGRIEVK